MLLTRFNFNILVVLSKSNKVGNVMAIRLHGILVDGLNKPIVNANVFLLARSHSFLMGQ